MVEAVSVLTEHEQEGFTLVPCGFTSSGLPVGLQVAGALFSDRTVLAAAHVYEQVAGWWRRRSRVEAAVPADSAHGDGQGT